MERFLLGTSPTGFLLSHLDYPSDSLEWRIQLVCPFWDWFLLASNRGSLLTSILVRFRRDKYTWWNFLVTVLCLAMQDWLYFLNVLGWLEVTRISEKSSGSRNIVFFSSVLHYDQVIDEWMQEEVIRRHKILVDAAIRQCSALVTSQMEISSGKMWTPPSSSRLTCLLCRSNRVMNFDTWKQ